MDNIGHFQPRNLSIIPAARIFCHIFEARFDIFSIFFGEKEALSHLADDDSTVGTHSNFFPPPDRGFAALPWRNGRAKRREYFGKIPLSSRLFGEKTDIFVKRGLENARNLAELIHFDEIWPLKCPSAVHLKISSKSQKPGLSDLKRLQFRCVNRLESGSQLATEELLSPHLELTNFWTPEGRNNAQISRVK